MKENATSCHKKTMRVIVKLSPKESLIIFISCSVYYKGKKRMAPDINCDTIIVVWR
jgi:hypothetical protein